MTHTLWKAHAYGNDFLLVEGQGSAGSGSWPALARAVCQRHRGLGADGLMVFERTPRGATSSLYNADGSPSELSGNGTRCLAAWIAEERGLPTGTTVEIGTGAGAKALTLLDRRGPTFRFRAAMGPPEALRTESLVVHGETITAVVLRVGNPQCVVLGPVTVERLHTIAAGLAVHSAFPEGTNVELAEVTSPSRVRILIWERGVGPTEASGTGACAAAVAAAAYGGAERTVFVESPGGVQQVEWADEGIFLTGDAELVGTMEWMAR
jgi:diaminopimelate epimerase